MNPWLTVLRTGWDLRPEILLTLGLAAALHVIGWRRLQARSGGRFRAGWRPAAYLTGLAVLALALMSPIDFMGGQLFFMHMVQHLLLVMIAVPLLLVADPFPFFMWGLPAGLRREIGRLLAPGSAFRRGLAAVTTPGIAWFLYIATLLGWHDPGAYSAAQGNGIVHDLEHLTFFGTALLFWWHATAAGPHVHRRLSRGARIGYLLAAVPPTVITGIAIAFSTRPIYGYYEAVPRVWGFTVLEDQMLSGIIMWIPGGMMYILAALVLVAQIIWGESRKPPLPEAEWASDEAMLAPGLEKR